ncbi:hypothetical protein IFM89_024105 [Coptis chinensis]|uniref:Transcription factor CBF/NF-Y/archaeal histone domain-containing protein n=1 Tax=Coptis chinensis TaxID=261450 RepID=A0A835HF96_9MAGN|nr:hypothetical protein IFM89_024105 [Coptis chinensis]
MFPQLCSNLDTGRITSQNCGPQITGKAVLLVTRVKLSESANNNDENSTCTVREQDRFLPIANVIRIMRRILPSHAKISDDAKETIQECVSEYISFITSEANERCQCEQRKTITAEDVLWAMGKLGFDEYIAPLTLFLHRYREFEGDRGSIRGDPLAKRTMEMAPWLLQHMDHLFMWLLTREF